MTTPDKIITLYDGKIQIGFWEARHRYSLIKNGVPENEWLISATGATSMLDKSRVLMRWATELAKNHLLEKIDNITEELIIEACNLYNIKREEAATSGTLAHKWIEEHINNQNPLMPDNEKSITSINAFLKWEKEHQVKWIATEKIVYSKKHGYVGLLDARAVIKGKTHIIDFKTSKGIYNEMRYQVASYRAAEEEETGKKISGDSLIIRFDKDTAKFEIHECKEHKKDFKAFLGLLAVKEREKELNKQFYDGINYILIFSKNNG